MTISVMCHCKMHATCHCKMRATCSWREGSLQQSCEEKLFSRREDYGTSKHVEF